MQIRWLSAFLLLGLFVTQLHAAGWALTADGYGATVEQAQKNAYAALVQRIRSEVKATTAQTTSDRNGQVDRSAERSIEVTANMLLKGVTYQAASKQGAEYQVLAVLSLAALKDSLAYYDKLTQFDPMGLNNQQKQDLYQTALQWQALLSVSPKITPNLETYQANLDQRLGYLDALRTAALMKVKVTPTQATLWVDGDIKPLNQPFTVSPGVHTLKLSADGYQDLIKQVQVNRGQARLSVESLVSESSQGKKLSVQIAPELQPWVTQPEVALLMSDVGWQAVNSSPYQLKVQGKAIKNEILGFSRYHFHFDIGVYHQGVKMKKVKFKTSVTVPENQDSARFIWQKVSSKVDKAIHLLAANVQF